MQSPRLRTVDKARPPYPINEFPSKFINKFGAEIVYMHATKNPMSIEGEEWEQVFANCIGAEWRPSNVGLDDVQLGSSCWSAKTVKSSKKNLGSQQEVRLISGRNSPTYSYGVDRFTEEDPDELGKMVLDIWNERVSAIRERFNTARTVVLVKSNDHSEFLIFETDTIRYEPDQYHFQWNKHGNLEGFDKEQNHRFTWQPHGSQFTIVEQIPPERLHLKIKIPDHLDKKTILRTLNYDDSWVMKMK